MSHKAYFSQEIYAFLVELQLWSFREKLDEQIGTSISLVWNLIVVFNFVNYIYYVICTDPTQCQPVSTNMGWLAVNPSVTRELLYVLEELDCKNSIRWSDLH